MSCHMAGKDEGGGFGLFNYVNQPMFYLLHSLQRSVKCWNLLLLLINKNM